MAALRELAPGVPLVQGGRSNGARVACRTAAAVGARAVIALAFPLHPPGPGRTRRAAGRSALGNRGPDTDRRTPRGARGWGQVLVVNGERDPFGIPSADDADRVVIVPGETHSLKGHRAEIVAAVAEWLPAVL